MATFSSKLVWLLLLILFFEKLPLRSNLEKILRFICLWAKGVNASGAFLQTFAYNLHQMFLLYKVKIVQLSFLSNKTPLYPFRKKTKNFLQFATKTTKLFVYLQMGINTHVTTFMFQVASWFIGRYIYI